MNTPVVADTSGFISLSSVTDNNHNRAVQGSISIQEQSFLFIVPGDVITETINVLGKKVSHEAAEAVGS